MTLSTNLIQAAIGYRRRGFSVIPIKAKDKRPLIPWETYQTAPPSEATITHWFTTSPSANVGLVTGRVSDCIVVDLDSDEAKEKFKSLVGDYDLSSVPRARTGRGGYHLFFKHPGESIPNRAGVIPKMDIRADGGYVVAAPSIHENGKPYKWEVPLNEYLPELPGELLKIIQNPRLEQGPRERFDTAKALAGVPEGQRDTVLFQLACKLRNADVPQDTAEQLVLEAAKNCNPPFPERTALEKVQRAYSKYQPARARPKQPEIWPELLTAKDLLELPPDPTRWIWDQTLPAGGASILVSKPKVGKTHFAVNLSIAVARGIPFLGRDTQQCGVVYLSLDASLPEISETFLSFGLKSTDLVFIHAGAAPGESLKWVMQRVNEKGARFVVVDTLQRLFRFQNVNDYSEVTNALEPLLEGARQQNCHVLFTHHAKKDSGDDLDSAIGSTAIRGLAYTYLHLKRLPDSERRILRSDQRSGKNISEMAIGFSRSGWLEIQGTMESVEIDDAEPKIIEFLQVEGGDVPEKEIRRALPIRFMIISKALRQMFKNGSIERTGRGKKGDPFKYSVTPTLMDVSSKGVPENPAKDSRPKGGILKGGNAVPKNCVPISSFIEASLSGTESEKDDQRIENVNGNAVPKKSGTEREQKGTEFFSGVSGTESGNSKKGVTALDALRVFPGAKVVSGS